MNLWPFRSARPADSRSANEAATVAPGSGLPSPGDRYDGPVVFANGIHYPVGDDGAADLTQPLMWVDPDFEERHGHIEGSARHGNTNRVKDHQALARHDAVPERGYYVHWDGVGQSHAGLYERKVVDMTVDAESK